MEKARGQATATTAGRPKYSVLRGLGVILREEGWRGFYRGHLTNLLHVAPAAAARFYSFEAYRSVPSSPPARACRVACPCVVRVESRADGGCSVQWLVRDGKPLPPLKRMLCGALAGITSTTLTYPLGTHRPRRVVVFSFDTAQPACVVRRVR